MRTWNAHNYLQLTRNTQQLWTSAFGLTAAAYHSQDCDQVMIHLISETEEFNACCWRQQSNVMRSSENNGNSSCFIRACVSISVLAARVGGVLWTGKDLRWMSQMSCGLMIRFALSCDCFSQITEALWKPYCCRLQSYTSSCTQHVVKYLPKNQHYNATTWANWTNLKDIRGWQVGSFNQFWFIYYPETWGCGNSKIHDTRWFLSHNKQNSYWKQLFGPKKKKCNYWKKYKKTTLTLLVNKRKFNFLFCDMELKRKRNQ